MKRVADKLLLFVAIVCAMFTRDVTYADVCALFLCLGAAALVELFRKRWVLYTAYGAYAAAACLVPAFVLFMPLVTYDTFYDRRYPAVALSVLLSLGVGTVGSPAFLFSLFMTVLALYLAVRTRETLRQATGYLQLQDAARETEILQSEKNAELLKNRDYEVRLAMLGERNRIAREIHDNVGHLLTRSILLAAALLARLRSAGQRMEETSAKRGVRQEEETSAKRRVRQEEETDTQPDPESQEQMEALLGTLNQAMNSIRESVHDLRDDAIALESAIESMLKAFERYRITYRYEIRREVTGDIKYCLLAVIKEALSNVARHSDATVLHIVLQEFQGYVQLLFEDNGTGRPDAVADTAPGGKNPANIPGSTGGKKPANIPGSSDGKNPANIPASSDAAGRNHSGSGGMGLVNMRDRVTQLGGTIHIRREDGFRIFVSIPFLPDREARI